MHREEVHVPRTGRQHICFLLRQLAEAYADGALMAEQVGLEQEWPKRIREQQAQAQLLAHELEMTQ